VKAKLTREERRVHAVLEYQLISTLEAELPFTVPGHGLVGVEPIVINGVHLRGQVRCACGFMVSALRAQTAKAALEDHRTYMRERGR